MGGRVIQLGSGVFSSNCILMYCQAKAKQGEAKEAVNLLQEAKKKYKKSLTIKKSDRARNGWGIAVAQQVQKACNVAISYQLFRRSISFNSHLHALQQLRGNGI